MTQWPDKVSSKGSLGSMTHLGRPATKREKGGLWGAAAQGWATPGRKEGEGGGRGAGGGTWQGDEQVEGVLVPRMWEQREGVDRQVMTRPTTRAGTRTWVSIATGTRTSPKESTITSSESGRRPADHRDTAGPSDSPSP